MSRSSKSEPRCRQFNLSLTDSEFESIRRRAEAVGMRPVHFGRALLLEPSHSVRPKRDEGDNLARLLYGQLVRLGSNLNQMVRHLHQTSDPLPPDLEPLLKDIRQTIARVRR